MSWAGSGLQGSISTTGISLLATNYVTWALHRPLPYCTTDTHA